MVDKAHRIIKYPQDVAHSSRHTNRHHLDCYLDVAHRGYTGGAFKEPMLYYVNQGMCRANCHKIIKLSGEHSDSGRYLLFILVIFAT